MDNQVYEHFWYFYAIGLMEHPEESEKDLIGGLNELYLFAIENNNLQIEEG